MNLMNMFKDYSQLYKYLYNLTDVNIKGYKIIEEGENVLIKCKFNYNSENIQDVYRSSYQFIINKNEYKLLYSYSDKVYFNNDGINNLYFYNIKNINMNITELLDGINIFMFYTDKWNIINDKNNKSNDLIKNTIFSNLKYLLNKSYQYNFILLDSNYKNLIDYEYRFGSNYKEIYHISTKYKNEFISLKKEPFRYIGIKYLDKLNDFNSLYKNTEKLLPKVRGLNIIIKNKNINYLLENESFKFFSLLKPSKNKYESFIKLYNMDLLEFHLSFYKDNKYIFNKKNLNEKYKTLRVIENSYDLLSRELYELFIKVWDLKDSSHKDKKLYNFLPTEYKVVLYRIKGIYFKNKQINRIPYLTYDDIVKYIKNIEYKLIIKLLIVRKKVKQNMENNITDSVSISFQQIYSKLDRDKLKMLAILTNYLCPNNEKQYKTNIEV